MHRYLYSLVGHRLTISHLCVTLFSRCLQIYILCMIALADGRDFVFILLRSCKRINKYGPKTKDQKEKCWLNVRQTHLKTENRSKSLWMSWLCFPSLNRPSLELTYIRVISGIGGGGGGGFSPFPAESFVMWGMIRKSVHPGAETQLCCLKYLELKGGRTDRRRRGLSPQRSFLPWQSKTTQLGWNVQWASKQPSLVLPRDHLVKDWLSFAGEWQRAFWPLGEERLIENALRRAGARSDH